MKTIFEGAEKYYADYRPSYPEQMIEDVVIKFGLSGQGALLDVGCGPGILTIPLSKYVKKVVAADIDSGMLMAGKERAKKLGITNIEWLNQPAESLSFEPATFNLITFGASFHWLDREKFAKLAYDFLTSDGGIFLAWGGNSLWNKERNEWEEKVLQTIKKYLGNQRRAGDGFLAPQTEKHEDILKKFGFSRQERKEYNMESQVKTAESIIKYLYTASYANKKLFGDKATDFEKELTRELLKINPDNKFKETYQAGAIFAWKDKK